MNDKNEAKQAIKRIDRIIAEWEQNYIESREMVELMVPDLKIIICYFERNLRFGKRGIVIEKKANNNQKEKEKEAEREK